jgi:tetratricopeptide (TPR) repeat protein
MDSIDDLDAYLRLAHSFNSVGNFEAAISTAQRALKIFEAGVQSRHLSSELLIELADGEAQAGLHERALEHYQLADEDCNFDLETRASDKLMAFSNYLHRKEDGPFKIHRICDQLTWNLLGQNYANVYGSDAMPAALSLVTDKNFAAAMLAGMGSILLSQGQLVQALDAFKALLSYAPQDLDALEAAIDIAKRLHRFEEAEKLCEAGISFSPNSVYFNESLCIALYANGLHDQLKLHLEMLKAIPGYGNDVFVDHLRQAIGH